MLMPVGVELIVADIVRLQSKSIALNHNIGAPIRLNVEAVATIAVGAGGALDNGNSVSPIGSVFISHYLYLLTCDGTAGVAVEQQSLTTTLHQLHVGAANLEALEA